MRRRLWRRLYRRSRLYVPLAAGVLVAMLGWLPLSPPWLARQVESRLARELGCPAEVTRVRMRLAHGEVDVEGVTIHPREGGQPFRVGRIHLDGELGELLAGQGRWPETVTLENVTQLSLKNTGDHLEATGALGDLIQLLGTRKSDQRSTRTMGMLDRPSPAMSVRNLSVRIDPPTEEMEPFVFSCDRLFVNPRAGAAEALVATLHGRVSSRTTEDLRATVSWDPGGSRLQTDAMLGGIEIPFKLPRIGPCIQRARDVRLSASLQPDPDGTYRLSGDLALGLFEVAEERVGGARWVDRDLRLLTSVTFAPELRTVRLDTAHLLGQEIDIRLSGEADFAGEPRGKARVQVDRLPTPLLEVGERQLRAQGFTFDRFTSSTLRADVAVEGLISEKEQAKVEAAFDVAGVRIGRPEWPLPIDVRRGRIFVSREMLELRDLNVVFGQVEGELRGRMPVPPGGSGHTKLELEGSLRGRPINALRLAKSLGVVPRSLNSFTMPVALAAHLSLPLELPPVGADGRRPQITVGTPEFGGTMNWGRGDIALMEWPQPITVESGSIEFTDRSVALKHVRASSGNLSLDFDGTAHTEAACFASPPVFDARAVFDGPIPEITNLLGTFGIEVPAEMNLGGTVRADARVSGRLDQPEAIDYALQVGMRDVAMDLALPDSTVHVDRLAGSLLATPDRIALEGLTLRLEQAAEISIDAHATTNSIEARYTADTPMWVAPRVDPWDLQDLVMDGHAKVEGTGSLVATAPLDPQPDVVRTWIGAFVGPGSRHVGIQEDSPLRLRLDGRITPGAGATFFFREFPHPITDVRGDVTYDQTGFYLRNVAATWGEAEDVVVNGYVHLGDHELPTEITFEADAPNLSINDWMDGWGQREWTERPFVRPERVRPDGAKPRCLATVAGVVRLGATEFLSVRAQNATANMRYEAWRGKENRLNVDRLRAETYGGRVEGQAEIVWPKGTSLLPRLVATANIYDVEMQGFLTDLHGRPDEFVGKFTGGGSLKGEIGDYSTWVSDGTYVVRDSRFIGGQVFRTLAATLNLGRTETEAPTTIQGSAIISDLNVRLPDMRLESSAIRMIADGSVDFSGNLDFLVTVNVLTNRLDGVPILGTLSRAVEKFTDFLVSLRVIGTVHEPLVQTIPLRLDSVGFFRRDGEGPVRTATEAMKAGQGVLGRGLRFAITAPERLPRRNLPRDEQSDSNEAPPTDAKP